MKKQNIQRKIDIVETSGRYLRALLLDGVELTKDRKQAVIRAVKHLQEIELPELLTELMEGTEA